MFENLPGSTWTANRSGRAYGPSTSKERWMMHDRITAVVVVTEETLDVLMTDPLVVVLGVE